MRFSGNDLGVNENTSERPKSLHVDGMNIFTTLYKQDDLNETLKTNKYLNINDYSLKITDDDIEKSDDSKKFILKQDPDEVQKREKDNKILLFKGKLTPIVGIKCLRKFTFWHITNNDENIDELFNLMYSTINKKGELTKLSEEKAYLDIDKLSKLYPNKRKTIEVDCSEKPYIILWYENVPHEIASSKAFNIFLGTTNNFLHKKLPEYKKQLDHIKQPKEYGYYKDTDGNKWQFKDSKEKKEKNNSIAINSLTQLESNLLGLMFGIGGIQHPGGHYSSVFDEASKRHGQDHMYIHTGKIYDNELANDENVDNFWLVKNEYLEECVEKKYKKKILISTKKQKEEFLKDPTKFLEDNNANWNEKKINKYKADLKKDPKKNIELKTEILTMEADNKFFRYQLPFNVENGIEIDDEFIKEITNEQNGWIIPTRVIEELIKLKNIKKMTYDIRKWNDIILEDYGFKKREGRLNWNPNWIPENREGHNPVIPMYLEKTNNQTRILSSNKSYGLKPPYYPDYYDDNNEDYDDDKE